jgi:hypothetical protein
VVEVGLDGGEAYRRRDERAVVLAWCELGSGDEEECVGLVVTGVGLISNRLGRSLKEIHFRSGPVTFSHWSLSKVVDFNIARNECVFDCFSAPFVTANTNGYQLKRKVYEEVTNVVIAADTVLVAHRTTSIIFSRLETILLGST